MGENSHEERWQGAGLAMSRRVHRGWLATGLIAAVVTLFVLPWTAREFATAAVAGRFVTTEFVVETYSVATEGADFVRGRIEATGERYGTDRISILGGPTLEALGRAGRAEGYRAPVRYMPPDGPWTLLDVVVPFRVQAVDEFGQTSPIGLLGITMALAGVSLWSLRRGTGQ